MQIIKMKLGKKIGDLFCFALFCSGSHMLTFKKIFRWYQGVVSKLKKKNSKILLSTLNMIFMLKQ